MNNRIYIFVDTIGADLAKQQKRANRGLFLLAVAGVGYSVFLAHKVKSILKANEEKE